MGFSHEKLDVYKIALDYVRLSFTISETLKGVHRHAREQLLRASQSIPLNIAEGNGKASENDRRRFFEIARGSALECAAIQDVLKVCKAISEENNQEGKAMLDRIVAMLTRLGKRGYSVYEERSDYGDEFNKNDSDTDSDTDTEI
jgi:four helix bundle protein